MDNKLEKFMMYASVVKTLDGKYKAVLSDDSVDRENEIVGKSLLEGALSGKIFGLVNHSNLVENRVCDWVNRKIETIKGHNALTAEPQWFMSNPKAKMIKGMLDDGAELGVSIGAMPTDSDTIKIQGKEHKRYTKGKILEGSFVGIPANENAGVVNTDFLLNSRKGNLLIAKELKIELMEGSNMPNENKQEVADKAEDIVKVMIDTNKEVTKEVVEKVLVAAGIEKEIYEEVIKDLPEDDKVPRDKTVHGNEDDDEEDDGNKKKPKKEGKGLDTDAITKLVEEKVTEKMKETPLYKAQLDSLEMTKEQVADKALEIHESGKLPIIRA